MNKVTVKQFLDAGFKLEMDDTIVTREGDTVHQMPDDILYDAIYIKHLMWRKNTGTQPVGDDCPVIVFEKACAGTEEIKCFAGDFKYWQNKDFYTKWKPYLEAIAQLEQVIEYPEGYHIPEQEWVDGLPPIGEVVYMAESRKSGGGKSAFAATNPGRKVKIYSHFTDDRGVKLATYISCDDKPIIGGVACDYAFETDEQKEVRASTKEMSKHVNQYLSDNDGDVNGISKYLIGVGYRKQ